MHILLVRFSSMGDVVLQTSVINWLRALFPKNLRLTFLTAKEFNSLLLHHPGLDQVIDFDRKNKESWEELVHRIKQLHVEHPIHFIFDLHGTLRSFRLRLRFWWIPSLSVDKRRWERFLLTKIKIPFFKKLIHKKYFGLEPQVMRILKDMENLFGCHLSIWKTQDFRQGPHGELTSLAPQPTFDLPKPYIVLSPSASFQSKRWPISYFIELSKKILEETSYHVVILAGPHDHFCSAFEDIKDPRLLNLQGKTSLTQTMSILSQSLLAIGNDSGTNHIAEAYGVPVLTIFGPTDPKFGFAPHGSSSRFIYKGLWCSPCSTTGKKDCFREQHYCMEMITSAEVFKEVQLMLEQK